MQFVSLKEQIEWISNSEDLNIYPETNSDTLRKEIAKYYNLKDDNIVCGVGSDELIDCIIKTFLELDESILINSQFCLQRCLDTPLLKAFKSQTGGNTES